MKRLLTAIALMVAVVCSGPMANAAKGNLKMAGSTTVLPLAQVWAEAFMEKNPDANISVSGGGTGTGISMLLNGSCAIATASREAKQKEIETARSRNGKMIATKLAKDGIAIIVNSGNNVKNVTMDQLAGIYNGKIDNWKSLGGHDSNSIVVVGRDSSSGTYGFFQEHVLGGGKYRSDMLSMASNAAVAQAVAQSKDAVGYVGIAYAKEFAEQGKVHILSISKKHGETGIMPNDETIKDGTYPLFRYLYAYTLGSPKGLAGDFLKFCTGSDGQVMVRKSGYLPLN